MTDKKVDKKKYWAEKEEEAIRKIVKEEISQKEADKLYLDIIHPALLTLTENIVNTYGVKHGFFKMGYSQPELIDMGLSFAYTKIKRFDPNRKNKAGYNVKAYSFFGTIIKRYLIQLSIKAQKSKQRHLDLDDDESFINKFNHKNLYVNNVNDISNDEKLFFKGILSWFIKYFDFVFQTEVERNVGSAALDIMKRVDTLDNFNKKMIYLYLREQTDLEARKITPVLNKMKDHYKHLKKQYLKNGKISSGSLIL